MVVYYINKVSERLSDCRYPIKEGDICMLYDGEVAKTIYVDSEVEEDSIWRDFKFIDTKSLKSYHFPKEDCVLCLPIEDKQAKGNLILVRQMATVCSNEWILDFLWETEHVLNGSCDYWDLDVLKRLTGNEDIAVTYEHEEGLSDFIEDNTSDSIEEEPKEVDSFDDDDDEYVSVNRSIIDFCLAALSFLDGKMSDRNYGILFEALKGESYQIIADKHNLTRERIRQIVAKTIKDAKGLFKELREDYEDTKSKNSVLFTQMGLLKEELASLRSMIPASELADAEGEQVSVDTKLAKLLDTSISELNLSVRATNVLAAMGLKTFVDIPQIESSMALLNARNSGRKTLLEIFYFLDKYGLTLGMSHKEIIEKIRLPKSYQVKENARPVSQQASNNVVERAVPTTNEQKTEEATIVLTKKMIEEARTPNGGFTKSQLAAIGIGWPPPPDWIEEKAGARITPAQLEAFNKIDYVAKPAFNPFYGDGSKTYKDIAYNSTERQKMEAILQAMNHFLVPATPRDIARTISRTAWGGDVIREDTVDSFLKRMPEIDYIQWGKYILKSRNKG